MGSDFAKKGVQLTQPRIGVKHFVPHLSKSRQLFISRGVKWIVRDFAHLSSWSPRPLYTFLMELWDHAQRSQPAALWTLRELTARACRQHWGHCM